MPNNHRELGNLDKTNVCIKDTHLRSWELEGQGETASRIPMAHSWTRISSPLWLGPGAH